MGKSFCVPRFLREVFKSELGYDYGGSDHKLMVIAVHAVLLDSGFIEFDPVSKSVTHGLLFPEQWPSVVCNMTLWYTLPKIAGIHNIELRFKNLGKFLFVYGTLSNGNTVLHSLSLHETRLIPLLNLVWKSCDASTEKEIMGFWKTVKDKMALPLLIDLCEKAGLNLPPCLMLLPVELKLKILELLPGVDIAKVGCLCLELRVLSPLDDDFWKQKFVDEGFVISEELEGGKNWKEKFGLAFKMRRSVSGLPLITYN